MNELPEGNLLSTRNNTSEIVDQLYEELQRDSETLCKKWCTNEAIVKNEQLPKKVKKEIGDKEDYKNLLIKEEIVLDGVDETIDQSILNQDNTWNSDIDDFSNIGKFEHTYPSKLPSGAKIEIEEQGDSIDPLSQEERERGDENNDTFIHIYTSNEGKICSDNLEDLKSPQKVTSETDKTRRISDRMKPASTVFVKNNSDILVENEELRYGTIDLETSDSDEKQDQFETGNSPGHLEDDPAVPKSIACQMCEYRTSKKSNFTDHFNSVHLKLRNFKCRLCDYASYKKSNFTRHIEDVHGDHDDPKGANYECQLCDYKTKKRYRFSDHVDAVHLKLRNFKCPNCDYASCRKSDLKRHVTAVHEQQRKSKKKNFICSMCEYAACGQIELKIHIETAHLEQRKFNCKFCGHASFKKTQLTKHVEAVHLNKRDYKCDLCDYAANGKVTLKRHVDAVHLKRKHFNCKFCDYAATVKFNLKRHIAAVHLK